MFERIEFNERDLQRYKNQFKSEINSNRRFEKITTIEELVSVLEDRDALTDDILLKCDQKFKNFVKSRHENPTDLKKLIIPENVVSLISKNLSDNWEVLCEHLKLREDQLKQCQNAEDVLFHYVKNCEGISQEEMIFRLNRALEKSGKTNIKNKVVELLKEN